MRLRQIMAIDEAEATALAGAALGPDFVLGDAEFDAGSYNVTALSDDMEPAYGFAPLDWHDDPDTLIAEVLALHHVSATLAERLLVAIREAPGRLIGDPVGDLAGGLAACLNFAPLTALRTGGSAALVGPPGAGKTTLAAKLAARAGNGRPILLNTNSERTGALEQLREYAGALGVGLESADDAKTIARTLRGRRGRIIIDTSGINPFDDGAIRRLAALIAAARAEPILVLPANVEPEEAIAMVGAFRALPIRRLLVTQLDIVRRLGGMLAAAEAGGYDIVGGSVTPHFAFGLRPLTPIVLARRLMSAAIDDRRWRTA